MVQIGIYKHYKGNLYQVLGVATHTETLEKIVMYKALKDEVLWARPLDMFLEEVFYQGNEVPRFKMVSLETDLG